MGNCFFLVFHVFFSKFWIFLSWLESPTWLLDFFSSTFWPTTAAGYVAHACAKVGAVEAAYHLSRLQKKCGRTKYITAAQSERWLGDVGWWTLMVWLEPFLGWKWLSLDLFTCLWCVWMLVVVFPMVSKFKHVRSHGDSYVNLISVWSQNQKRMKLILLTVVNTEIHNSTNRAIAKHQAGSRVFQSVLESSALYLQSTAEQMPKLLTGHGARVAEEIESLLEIKNEILALTPSLGLGLKTC